MKTNEGRPVCKTCGACACDACIVASDIPGCCRFCGTKAPLEE